MTTAEVVPYAAESLDSRMAYAETLARAGDLIPRSLFGPPIDGKPPQPSPGKVLLVLETGAMLGLHPIAALSGINVIEGKPAASAALMSAVIRGAGHKLHVVESGSVEGGDYAATVTLTRTDDAEHPFVSVWTPQRAARAGLGTYAKGDDDVWRFTARSQNGKPLPWESYTENLCKARGVSEVARDGAQDALNGIRYTPEELGATVDDRGDIVDLPAEPEPTPAAEPSALPPTRKRATRGTQGVKRATEEPVDAEVVTDDAPAEPADSPDAVVVVADGATVTATDAETGEVVAEKPAPEDGEAEAAEVAEAAFRERQAAEATARAAAADAEPAEEFQLQEPPIDEPDWEALSLPERVAAARTPAELKLRVWDVVQGTPQLTKELQDLVLARKSVLENAEEAARAAAATDAPAKGKASETRAAVLGD